MDLMRCDATRSFYCTAPFRTTWPVPVFLWEFDFLRTKCNIIFKWEHKVRFQSELFFTGGMENEMRI